MDLQPWAAQCTGPGLWPCPAGGHPLASSVVFCLWYFAIVILATELMRWANRPRNVPVQKLRFKAGGRSEAVRLPSPFSWCLASFSDPFHSCCIFCCSTDCSFLRFLRPTPGTYFVVEKFCLSPYNPNRAVLHEPFLWVCVNCWDLFGLIAWQVFTDVSCRKWSFVSPIHSAFSKAQVWHFFKGKVVDTFGLQKSFSSNLILVP